MAQSALFDFCLPKGRPLAELPQHWLRRLKNDEYVFTGQSSDLCFLEAAMLRPEQLSRHLRLVRRTRHVRVRFTVEEESI